MGQVLDLILLFTSVYISFAEASSEEGRVAVGILDSLRVSAKRGEVFCPGGRWGDEPDCVLQMLLGGVDALVFAGGIGGEPRRRKVVGDKGSGIFENLD